RGLFGISINAQTKTITVNPHLPASWNSASLKHIAVGSNIVDLLVEQTSSSVTVRIQGQNPGRIRLASSLPGARQLAIGGIEIPRAPVEIEPEISAPLPGARTESARVLSQTRSDRTLTFTLEGLAGSEFRIPLFENAHLQKLVVTGAKLQSPTGQQKHLADVPPTVLTGHFPPGTGWQTVTVTLTW
ncbi:MAG TPA: hypothetical protein VMV57_04395, partial [Terracidiphilus sp.]|nr:hypothetical protein [Terracidiphilus sp.]